MKKLLFALGLLPLSVWANEPDEAYLFIYQNGNGLAMAWSGTGKSWTSIGGGRTFVSSDFGTWGREKKMYDPCVAMLGDGTFVAVWALNERVNQFSVCTTSDLMFWQPQDYPYMEGVGQCLHPHVIAVGDKGCSVTFTNKDGKQFTTTATDCYHFTAPLPAPPGGRADTVRSLSAAEVTASPLGGTGEGASATIDGTLRTGQVFRLPMSRIKPVINFCEAKVLRDQRHGELARDNAQRFAGINHVDATVTVDMNDELAISDKLMGIFFEDINYSADGGLYAELVQNRDFEYSRDDRGEWHALTAWDVTGTVEVRTDNPIHENNSHYVHMPKGTTLTNNGYDGMVVKQGAKYDVSLFTRGGAVTVKLMDGDKVLAQTKMSGSKSQFPMAASSGWKQAKATIKPTASSTTARLVVEAQADVDVDFISLFPQDTFKGRKNGMRKDLAQALADIHPKFMRFPGGCVAHGNGLDNMYRWKQSIGPLHERKQDFNIWGYHQSRGIGYYEYFCFCEDLGMEPLPVLPAGVCCQNSSKHGDGQQGGLKFGAEMDEYIQEVLDLIEWANGDPKTSKWAKMRAEAGHPKPFNLKMIGIGNEDLISHTFEERFIAINKAIREKYPEIEVCGTAGPFFEGSDYERGWQIVKQEKVALVDEHYYTAPGWYVWNHDYYDNYERGTTRVYLGEYAAHGPGRPANIESALCEALHYCSIERNGDVVAMTSYAPLLAKEHHTQWNPDMIYFTNTEVHPTTTYWAQLMNGQNCGDRYLTTRISTPERRTGVQQRLEASCVRDSKTGKTYLKIVNVTGIPATATLAIPGLEPKEARCVTLSGAWDDKTARPVEGKVQVADGAKVELEPYAFKIIEL